VIDDPILPHDWRVVARATELGDEPKAVRLLDRELVLWRSDDGLHA
jgi:phenylpropionate dioxygenase-like ring-hydroxylating dioxygenase large terminal subunit